MPLTDQEQEIYDVLKSTLPRWFWHQVTNEETWFAFVKIFDELRTKMDSLLEATQILQASSFWLDLHARDRGLFPQNGESDAALQERIRNYADAVTPAAIVAAATAALEADSVTIPEGYPGLVELRRDKAYMGTNASPAVKMAYMSRGYRMSNRTGIIVILPYGTTAETEASVAEAVRVKKAGGIPSSTERRLNP